MEEVVPAILKLLIILSPENHMHFYNIMMVIFISLIINPNLVLSLLKNLFKYKLEKIIKLFKLEEVLFNFLSEKIKEF